MWEGGDVVTNLEKKCRKELMAYVKEHEGDVESVSHVHPRAFVVGRAAACCLVVAYPHLDSTPLILSMNKGILKDDGLNIIRMFDPELTQGDWCTIGYVCRYGCQETVAIKAVTS